MANPKDLMPVTYTKVDFKPDFPTDRHFIAKIQPLIAKNCHLCEYDLQFLKLKNPETGKWEYPFYTLDSRNFPPRNLRGGKSKELSVLPEILTKLMNPLSPTVSITHWESVKDESKSNVSSRKK